MADTAQLQNLAEESLTRFVEAAKASFGADLVSVVLYGSGAEGRLRSTSDVNLLMVLKSFEQAKADSLREPMRFEHAAINLNVMFILESELHPVAEAFAVKFADIRARHRVLHGADLFRGLDIPRDAILRRLHQVLLNFQLRLRERYMLVSLRDEQLGRVIADAAGPLRSSAAALLLLEGRPTQSPRLALEQVVAEMNDPALKGVLEDIVTARAGNALPPGKGAATVMALIGLTGALRARLDRIGPG